jgi:hypothetical protein
MPQGRRIWREHETLADENAKPASRSLARSSGAKPGFADGDAGVGNALDEFERSPRASPKSSGRGLLTLMMRAGGERTTEFGGA